MSVLILIALCLVALAAAVVMLPANDAAIARTRAASRAAELEEIGAKVQVRSAMLLQTALRSVDSEHELAIVRDGTTWERLLSGLDLRDGMRPELRIDGQGSLIFRLGDVDVATCSMVNAITRSARRGCYEEGGTRFYFVVLNRLSERLAADPYEGLDAPDAGRPATRLRTQHGVPSAMR